MKALRLEKGDAAFYQHEDVVVAKYRAKKNRMNGKPKELYVLSTAHAPAMGHTNKRDKDGNTITKPTCIISYNQNMGGVDMMDQTTGCHRCPQEVIQMVQEAFSEAGDAVQSIST